MLLSRVSIKRPVLASMMSLALVLFGVISLTRLPVRELPDIDPPIVSVTTVYPGADARVVETEVTERLEEAINNIEGIKTLTSSSREQVSTITIEFNLSREIDLAAQDVRDCRKPSTSQWWRNRTRTRARCCGSVCTATFIRRCN